jgi:hypothetical protein
MVVDVDIDVDVDCGGCGHGHIYLGHREMIIDTIMTINTSCT